jgi:hypothetical protein
VEHPGQGAPDPIDLLVEALLVLKVIQQFNNISPANSIRGSVAKGRHNMVIEVHLDMPPLALVWLAVSLDIFGG